MGPGALGGLDRLVLQELQPARPVRRRVPGLLVRQQRTPDPRAADRATSAQAYYFLTGEQIKRRVDVTPNRNFTIRNGRITGPGAIEVHARFADFNVGHDVFTAGLADPNLWTNQVYAIDTGVNWYLNQYTKIYFDWQHSIFGNRVFNGQSAFHKAADLFWLRFQLFF